MWRNASRSHAERAISKISNGACGMWGKESAKGEDHRRAVGSGSRDITDLIEGDEAALECIDYYLCTMAQL